MSGFQIAQKMEQRKDPALKTAQGVNYRRLSKAVLQQALDDAMRGRDIDYLSIWVHRDDVELYCLLGELDVNFYRKQLEEILADKFAEREAQKEATAV